VLLENDQFFGAQKSPIFKHYAPSASKIHRPVPIARFLCIQKADLLVSSGDQLGAKEVARAFSQFLVTALSQKLQCVHFVLTSDHLFDECQ